MEINIRFTRVVNGFVGLKAPGMDSIVGWVGDWLSDYATIMPMVMDDGQCLQLQVQWNK